MLHKPLALSLQLGVKRLVGDDALALAKALDPADGDILIRLYLYIPAEESFDLLRGGHISLAQHNDAVVIFK